MTRVADEPGLVLHVRPYRETSAIVSLLTLNHGRVAVVARGLRAPRTGRRRENVSAVLQPFNQVRLSWTGRGSLGTLTACESIRHVHLEGDSLAAGFYLLELVNRLIGEHEAVPSAFAAACWCLGAMQDRAEPIDLLLRRFEKVLLESLGYGVEFDRNAQSGETIEPEARYVLVEGLGFVPAPADGAGGFAGSDLLAIADGSFSGIGARRTAKRVFRDMLDALLGPRPLASRQLLVRRQADGS